MASPHRFWQDLRAASWWWAGPGNFATAGGTPPATGPLIHALIWSVPGVHFASGMPVAADVPIGAAIKSTAPASRPVVPAAIGLPLAAVNMPEPARLERSARKSCQLSIFDLGCAGRDMLK